jgi:hypothetical protein
MPTETRPPRADETTEPKGVGPGQAGENQTSKIRPAGSGKQGQSGWWGQTAGYDHHAQHAGTGVGADHGTDFGDQAAG